MSTFTRFFTAVMTTYVCSTSAVYAKSIEDIFTEMLSIRETDPAGFWSMVTCIALLFALAFGLMALTMGYYVRHWFKRK